MAPDTTEEERGMKNRGFVLVFCVLGAMAFAQEAPGSGGLPAGDGSLLNVKSCG
jgi:hypothetical protein